MENKGFQHEAKDCSTPKESLKVIIDEPITTVTEKQDLATKNPDKKDSDSKDGSQAWFNLFFLVLLLMVTSGLKPRFAFRTKSSMSQVPYEYQG